VCADEEILVRAPGPKFAVWKLTKEELSEHFEPMSRKANLLVTLGRDYIYDTAADAQLSSMEQMY
jgi:hypothetical protein